MTCLYYYKGKLIGNEIQLNDFLIERKQFHSKYGDIVFDRSVLASHVANIVDTQITPESASWKAKMDAMWRSQDKKYYDDDGEKVIIYDRKNPPFIGVNKYIDHFGDDGNGQRLTAEFKPDEFWPRMFKRWNEGNFENSDLVDIIKSALPQKVLNKKGHPAKQTFQALRIAVNDELQVFEKSLLQAIIIKSIS